MAKESIVIAVDKPVLVDLEGNDAMLQASPELRSQVQRAAIATMPTVYLKALEIVKKSKNEKMVLEAMKFIKDLSEGEISARNVDAYSKTLSDEEILRKLDGKYEDID